MLANYRYALGIIGTGHIAHILVNRWIESQYLSADRIIVTPSRALTAHPLNVHIAADASEVISESRMILISVTPQKFHDLAHSIRGRISPDQLCISVMAGVGTERVALRLGGEGIRVIRAMPNLPFGLGRGVTGLFRGHAATQEDLEQAEHLFSAGGATVTLDDEALMDAVTAVAGSGPAYFYYFVEMMMAGGVAAGLKAEDAQVLAAHACVGAGAMLLQKGASPQDLRAAVTSPGGTTEAAMKMLRECNVSDHVVAAVMAAFNRGRELGKANS